MPIQEGVMDEQRREFALPANESQSSAPVESKSRVNLVVLLLLLLSAACVLSWLIAGRPAWKTVSIIGTVIVALVGVGCFVTLFDKTSSASDRVSLLLVLAYVGVVVFGWMFFGRMYTRVIVDNYCGAEAVIELDGKPWLTVSDESTTATRIPTGVHTIVMRSAPGKTGKIEITAKPSTRYILNVFGAMNYVKGTAFYGSRFISKPNEEANVSAPWLEADVDLLFEGPPATVSVSKGTRSVTRTYLKRGAVKAEAPRPPSEKEMPPPPEDPTPEEE
jgi:hypothetical protein